MVEIRSLEIGSEYEFVINQRGSEYEAVILVEDDVSSSSERVIGTVQESTYPNDGWSGKMFRVHADGTVDMSDDPFGPIGEVVSVSEV